MNVFDLHCDTLSEAYQKQVHLKNNDLQLDIAEVKRFEHWVQTFAFFLSDKLRGEQAWDYFERLYDFYLQEREQNSDILCDYRGEMIENHCQALLSIEGGSVLGGKLERLRLLRERKFWLFTLTWNAENEFGGGANSSSGLTPLGKDAVRELERQKIILDVSHLSDNSFYDAMKIATKPMVASHSNARALCNHPRNLTDDQIRCLIERGGVIGLNFYPVFVNLTDDCSLFELCLHAERVLSLGGEQNLCLGSDFDGATMPKALQGIKGLEKLRACMVEYLGEEMTERIFFRNAISFYRKVMT